MLKTSMEGIILANICKLLKQYKLPFWFFIGFVQWW